jgi:hypothetical protein
MNRDVGVWIDRRHAVLVPAEASADGGIMRVTTDLEKQLRLSGGRRGKTSYGTQTAPADDMRETSSRENLNIFFDDVIAALGGAHSIFMIDGVETVGRMSDRQIAAKVREHYRPRV